MNRAIVVLALIGLLVVSVLAGCATTTPTPTAAPQTSVAPGSPTPTGAASPPSTPASAPQQVQTIEMKLASNSPPASPTSKWLTEEWAPRIEQATEGRVKIVFYWSETLGKAIDQWDYVRQGVCDITSIVNTFYPGKFPVTEVSDLPFLYPTEDPWKCLQLQHTLWDEYFAQEYSEVKVLWLYSSQPVDLISRTRPVRVMEDLKGMQLGFPGGPMGRAFELLGATPAQQVTPEAYMALDRGVIEAYALPIQAQLTFKLGELGKYETMLGIVCGQFVYAMNLDTWNRLLPQDKQAFDDISKLAEQNINGIMVGLTNTAIQVFTERGIEIIHLTPEERARWAQTTQPLIDDWIASMEKQGYPAGELVAKVRELAAQ